MQINIMDSWCCWCCIYCLDICCCCCRRHHHRRNKFNKNNENNYLFTQNSTTIEQETPIKTVRRISSVGQTLTNDNGEEIEMPRHTSVLQSYNGVSIPWSSNPITIQPGVSKIDFEKRLKTMPTITETPPIQHQPRRHASWKFPPSFGNFNKREFSPTKYKEKSMGEPQGIRFTAKNSSGEQLCSIKEKSNSFYKHKNSHNSSPNLMNMAQSYEKHSSSNFTLDSMSNASLQTNLAKSTTWLHSQSLEDVKDKTTQSEAEKLARQYGLDLSLYKDIDLNLELPDDPVVDQFANFYDDESVGFIEFCLYVNNSQNMISIFISKIGGLVGVGENRQPFSVQLKISPISNKNIIKNSKKIAPNLNPIINQSFTFFLKNKNQHVLRVSVYNADFQGRFDAIGHALISFDEYECNKNYQSKLYRKSVVGLATGMIQICCQRIDDKVQINVLKVLNLLPKFRNNKLYIKISYYCQSRKSKEKISPIHSDNRGQGKIDFNHLGNFRVDFTGRKHNYFVVSLKKVDSHTMFKNDETIGRVFFGPNFFTENGKLTPWGRLILNNEKFCLTYKMYL